MIFLFIVVIIACAAVAAFAYSLVSIRSQKLPSSRAVKSEFDIIQRIYELDDYSLMEVNKHLIEAALNHNVYTELKEIWNTAAPYGFRTDGSIVTYQNGMITKRQPK